MTTPYAPTRWSVPSNGRGDDQDVFPFLAGQSFLGKKTPVWSTDIKTSVSGVERRRALWSYPIWKFKLSYELLRMQPSFAEWQRLTAFFNMKAGQFQGWFFYDQTDNSAVNQQIGVGDGVTKTFQLTRTTTYGSITFTEPVRGVYGTPTVTVGGSAASSFTIGPYGSITFASAPPLGSPVVWSGSFFFLCRFSKDELDAQQLMASMYTLSGLEFQTFKG